MTLTPLQQEFVLHFGEMGSRWGINRTVGQIYALLFLSSKPLNAEQITEALSISRSNTSMGLKELQSWNLVRLKHFQATAGTISRRIQFGANISFHILFPTITIALGWVLLFFKLRFNATGDAKWMDAYRFWVKVFALSFAMGVVSGITMSFQFGTNWPGFMETVGNIAGPLLAYEVLTAFFLEAVFLGIMLFGIPRAGLAAHAGDVPGGLRHDHVGLLDPRAEQLDAHARGLRDARRRRLRHRLAGDHLQPVDALPPGAHAAGLGPDRGLPDRRASRPSAGSGRPLARCARPAHRRVPRRAADPAADPRRRHARAEHARASAGQGRGDGGQLGDRKAPNVPLLLFALPDEEARENDFEIAIPNGASLILTTSRRRGPRPERLRGRRRRGAAPAGGAGLLVLRIMVGDGHGDARCSAGLGVA
jgi:hypothetical protein